MKAAVIVFPGSNCDRDVAYALERVTGRAPAMVWHKDQDLPDCDLIVLPGGFSHGDYLRSGAIAAQAPIMEAVRAQAARGVAVLGICNGFQILTEAGLLPGGLLRNASLKYICKDVTLSVETTDSIYTGHYQPGQIIRVPIAHHDGQYVADEATLDQLEGDGRIAFRYAAPVGNPNGSARNIAGIFSADRRILGLMPHPERLIEPALGGSDGLAFFTSLAGALA
jgi:phosphoribosylformylglycinamidine synthase subunit PurQ / glutaminase